MVHAALILTHFDFFIAPFKPFFPSLYYSAVSYRPIRFVFIFASSDCTFHQMVSFIDAVYGEIRDARLDLLMQIRQNREVSHLYRSKSQICLRELYNLNTRCS